jgi:hypothetical protein
VTLKSRLENQFKGWSPQEPYLIQSKQSTNPKSSIRAYIAGYGVGIGIGELYILLVNELGWGAIRSTLSPALSLLLGLFVLFPGVLLGMAIGAKLSRKLKERWIH